MFIEFSWKWFTVLTIPIVFSACQDHQLTPDPERFRLKKTVYTNAIKFNTPYRKEVVYSYNSTGNLEKEVATITSTYENRVIITLSAFVYDAQNRLIRINSESDLGANLPIRRIEYTYDADGNIAKETASVSYTGKNTGDYTIIGQSVFTYAGSRFPLKQVYTNSSTVQVYDYTYSNGNISQLVSTQTAATPYPAVTNTYQYDDKPNPYYGVIRGDGLTAAVINKNNVIDEMTSPAPKYKRVLTYDSLGLLTKLNIVYPPDPYYNYNSQTTYEYEKY
ncbi:hypothetical protein [Spirosoma migulaei]